MKINKKNILPIVIAVTVYLLSYQIPKLTVPEYRLHYLETSLDFKIKLFSPAITIYYLAFFQWINAIFILLKQDTKIVNKYATAFIIGSLIGFICFMVYPTAVNRPEIVGNSFFDNWLKYTYFVDSIVCACPSFHCFVSTVVIYIMYDCKVENKYIMLNIVISILVYLSTLLTKQHVLIDIPMGILLAILSVKLTDRFTIPFNTNK